VNQQPIVRHYRGAARADVEAAYRADAGPAINAGYMPVGHVWSHDQYGLLLAVSYQAQAAPVPAGYVAPAQPGYAQPLPTYDQPATYVQPQPVYAQPQPPAFAPASNGALPVQVVQPQQRYTPPPEMYQVPPDMYAPAPQVAPPAAPIPPAAPAMAPVLTAPAPAPAAAPQAAPDYENGSSRQTRLTIQTMDLHTAGEPLRIIRSGFPDVPHMPVLERRRWVLENADYVRRAIIQEPRGHRDMYGAILLPPYNDYADMTVLFMHNEGYSTMCGHGIIAITTGLIEEGLFPATEPVTTIRYEVPAGIVAANAATVQLEDGSWAVRGVRFTNVPSYLAAQSLAVRPDGVKLYGPAAQYGALSVDIAFGGAYYGIVNAADLGLRVVPEQAEALRHAGAAITDVLRRDHTPQHPTDPALGFVYGTIIVDMDPRTSPDGRAGDAHLRNVTVFADAEVDRSPCGSGTSALLAQLHARGRLRVGQEIVNAGITGEHFLGRIEAETALGPYRAVSTSIAGTAYVTGYSTYVVDSRDPLGDGFLLS
jgi:trans-L-3-hydroxyproline dehydratase